MNPNEPLYIEVYKCGKDLWTQQIEAIVDRIQKSKLDGERESSKAVTNEIFAKPSLFCRIRAPQSVGQLQRN